jgi:hypothetical protein
MIAYKSNSFTELVRSRSRKERLSGRIDLWPSLCGDTRIIASTPSVAPVFIRFTYAVVLHATIRKKFVHPEKYWSFG